MKALWDIHNHILPGVDDGSSCMDETEILIEMEYSQGVRNVVFTPHCRKGMFEVSSDDRLAIFMDAVSNLNTKYPDMNFYLGCEMYATDSSLSLLGDELNRINGSRVVLLEFDYEVAFDDMLELIGRVISQNYAPVIAHAERYSCLRNNDENLGKLRDFGCKIQINADAVIGKNGLRTRFIVARWLKADLVDLIASDAHNVSGRTVKLGKAFEFISGKYGHELAERLFCDNARMLVRGI